MIIDTLYTDIIIVGAGLGGIMAAEEAGSTGKDIIITTSGEYCSGASFYGGTWGLGMVGPKDNEDLIDFVESINRVGCDIPNKELSKQLLLGIDDLILKLKDMGVDLKEPDEGQEVTPCFDYKPRKWFGFDHASARKAFDPIKYKENIKVLKSCNLIKIFTSEDIFKGALFVTNDGKYILIYAKAIIIATGGFTNIYKYNVSSSEMGINSHIPVLEVGCNLINMEFIQFIPSHVKPNNFYKTIFNERAFNYVKLEDFQGKDLINKYFPELKHEQDIISERSTYGPFTSRLPSRIIDLSMFKEYQNNNNGAFIEYPDGIADIKDTLIYNYFQWFNKRGGAKGQASIIPFAHASNGGIAINEKGETSIKGIYAAGETTGGMHGADRIGGISSLNAGVFGIISARNGVEYVNELTDNPIGEDLIDKTKEFLNGKVYNAKVLSPDSVIKMIREIIYKYGAIIRTEVGLELAIKEIDQINDNYNLYNHLWDSSLRKKSFQAENYIKLSRVILKAMNNREESRGSHYREDFPMQKGDFTKSQFISFAGDEINYYFKDNRF